MIEDFYNDRLKAVQAFHDEQDLKIPAVKI